jgi:hypothetical protein
MPQLFNLRVGEQFEIPYLQDSFRNLAVLRLGECSVLVTGQEKDGSDSAWKTHNMRLAPTTTVESLGTFLKVTQDEEGSSIIEGVIHDKRGRKVKQEVEFPDGDFKIKELAETLKLEYHTVMNSFNRRRDEFVEVRKEANGGRGRAISVFSKK